MLGPDAGESAAVEFLGRSISWHSWGLRYEADEKHVTELLRQNDMSDSRAVTTPALTSDTNFLQVALEKKARVLRRHGHSLTGDLPRS